jgi:hypothetical protein
MNQALRGHEALNAEDTNQTGHHNLARLQGQLEVATLAGTGEASAATEDIVKKVPFFMLSLDLPAARLFQDAMEKDIIPQVSELYPCSMR